MLNKLFKSIKSLFQTLIGSPVEQSPEEKKIGKAVSSLSPSDAEVVTQFITGASDNFTISNQSGLEQTGRSLIEEFTYNSPEMIQFYNLLALNGMKNLIFPLIRKELNRSDSELKSLFTMLAATSLTPIEIVEYYTQSTNYKEYSSHFQLFAELLLPDHERDIIEKFTLCTEDTKRSLWASIAVLSENDLITELKDHIKKVPFVENCNYSLSAISDSEFTQSIIQTRIKEWLESKSLDKSGKILTILENGDISTPLSANLCKQLRSEFYSLFIQGLHLEHKDPFIKSLIFVASNIDPDQTLAKLSAKSVTMYVEQGYISFQTALSFFILKGKGKHLEKLLELNYDVCLEQLAQSEQLLLNSLTELWSFDPARAFRFYIKLIPNASDNAKERLLKKMESYSDGFDEVDKLLSSRRIILRETAVHILKSFDTDEAKKALEDRLITEKNSDVKAKITEALKEPEDDTPVKSRVVELIMVTSNNNNKYYRMIDNKDSFTVEFGRVGGRSQKATYPISEWDKKYREKIRKGYTDNTKLFLKKSSSVEYKDIDDKVVKQVLNDLMEYSNKTIFNNYTVTAENVTRQQVDKAQSIIDTLAGMIKIRMDVSKLNETLLELYQVIPRKMKNVNDHLYSKASVGKEDIRELEVLLSSEQDTLDAMSSKLRLIELEDEENNDSKEMTILEAMGLKIRQVDRGEEKKIKGMMRSISGKYQRAYAVENVVTQSRFDAHVNSAKNKNTELYFHGSRNENFLNILQTGLLIRPSGAIYTGSMFGDGIYFADKAIKSLGYTSLRGSYWASGSANRGFLSIFKVHMGKQFEIKKHSSWCTSINEKILEDKGGYNSVFAKGGADLRNNEMIVYNSRQCTINYLIELG